MFCHHRSKLGQDSGLLRADGKKVATRGRGVSREALTLEGHAGSELCAFSVIAFGRSLKSFFFFWLTTLQKF